MTKVRLHARLLAPVVIKRDRQSERSAGVRSAPGTVIRGALASSYLQRHGRADDTFKRLFLNEAACRFGPLDPGPRIFPLTAASCKHDRLTHALVDQLWFRAAQHHAGCRMSGAAVHPWQECAQCAADLKPQEGFWRADRGNLYEMRVEPDHVAAHVGIDRSTATAADEMFFTLEAIAPSGKETDLYGWIRANDAALGALERLLHDEDGRISMGHARTRGYGDVVLRVEHPRALEDANSRVHRWNQWSCALSEFLASSAPDSVRKCRQDSLYFALSFPTGAVIVDRFLRYSVDPAAMIDWLPPMSAVGTAFPLEGRPVQQLDSGGAVRWIAAVTRHERLRGWNAAHGLPRQDDWAVARGAVYLYCFEGAQSEREPLIERLDSLTGDGVGLRRNEGFGIVDVCDEFHHRFHRQEDFHACIEHRTGQ
ncbi:MAG: RAMP superfamily CRISPR-associated protein [Spirochaetaceae bacterium]|nr:RAMP superfamily CRISPR-associated protein [Spirochaetaceae bacterium]